MIAQEQIQNKLKQAQRLENKFLYAFATPPATSIWNWFAKFIKFLTVLFSNQILNSLNSGIEAMELYMSCRYYEKAISICLKTEQKKQLKPIALFASKQFVQLFEKIKKLSEQCIYIFDQNQRINYYNNLLKIYEKSKAPNSKLLELQQKKLWIFLYLDVHEPSSSTYQNVINSYSKTYQMRDYQKKQETWDKIVKYQFDKKSSCQSIQKLYKKLRYYANVENGLIDIYSKNEEQAWRIADLLRKTNFLKLSQTLVKILTYIDLHHHNQLRSFYRSSNLSTSQKIFLQEITNRLEASQNLSEEQQIRKHEQRIQFYRENQYWQSIQYASNSLLRLLHLSVNVKQTHDKCVKIYEGLIQLLSKTKGSSSTQQQSIKLKLEMYLKLLRFEISISSPNYKYLLSVREKHFNPSLENALLLLCLKQYERAKKLIDFWRIQGVLNSERDELKEIIRLLQLKDIEGLEKYFNLPLTDKSTIDTLKTSLILGLKAQKELAGWNNEKGVLIDLEE